ncbi:HupE/UreJ family protein [soil metagenome]
MSTFRSKLSGALQADAWPRMISILLLFLQLAFWSGAAHAHEMSMAELDMRELSKGEFMWSWGQSGTSKPISADLTPIWPTGCVAKEQSLHCAAPGLVGNLAMQGVGKKYSAAMVRINWLDGQSRVYTITAAQPTVYLYGAANDQRGAQEIVVAYTLLGIEHILTGFDHLLFVFSLLFLVGFNRRLVATITAFTVAHSLTLVCSVLGLVTLRTAPVEASIALSIVLVAAEALRQRETLARRLPALVAFIFGLVHGLGFAGALKEIGLPENYLALALLTFNVGVEVGQLLTVGAAFALTRYLSRYRWFANARKPALYGIGVLAAYWSWLRIAAIVT